MLEMMQETPSPWTVKEVAAACRICPTAATRKLLKFERGVQTILRATAASLPKRRPCDLAQMMAGLLVTGGQLGQFDRDRLTRRLRELLRS